MLLGFIHPKRMNPKAVSRGTGPAKRPTRDSPDEQTAVTGSAWHRFAGAERGEYLPEDNE